MVWWVDKNESIASDNRIYDKYVIEEDRIIQTVNIMFNFVQEITDAYDIYAISQSGVNIFNIDRTIFKEPSYNLMKKAIIDSRNFPNTYSKAYFRPLSLSVTMSVLDPTIVDEDVDLVILKDVHFAENINKFKKSHMTFKAPVLLWISKCHNDDVIDLIRVSDGIVLDFSVNCLKFYREILEISKQYCKPVFCIKHDVSDDIHEFYGGKRRLFVVASNIINDGYHGVVINSKETSVLEHRAVVKNIVEAMRVAENVCDPKIHLETFAKQIKIPQLLTMTTAIAASSAAFTSKTSAIIILTTSGKTARLVSHASPPCHILAITASKWVAQQMHLYRKVLPLLYEAPRAGSWQEECRKRVLFGSEFAVKTGLVDGGAKLVVLAPAEEGMGYCDAVQIVAVPFKCDE